MTDRYHKLCLVQPSNEYQVVSHKYALALTFPYLIRLLSLDEKYSLCLYVEGKSELTFSDFLHKEQPYLVFITSNTATFPSAVKLAHVAKTHNCFVVLGGIFASMNATVIARNYTCFDKIIQGGPFPNFFEALSKDDKIIKGENKYDINFELGDILNRPLFDCYRNDPVCYELTFGCVYNCTFCSLRYIWGTGICSHRTSEIINHDLKLLNRWNTLKIIDDDILQSQDVLSQCDFRSYFKKIIAETRIDRINEKSISVLKQFGITHLIMGVETFDNEHLASFSKSHSKDWMRKTYQALELCNKHGITARPVLQILYPQMSKRYLKDIVPYVEDWTPQNNIEVFFSFFTPHPGLSISKRIAKNLLTNDLSQFDHLHPVYMPDEYTKNDIKSIIDDYNKLVDITNSVKYNPYVHSLGKHMREFDIFFSAESQE